MGEQKVASAAEVKKFFDFKDMTSFKDEWTALTEEDKEYFRVEVGRLIHKEGE